MELLVFIKKYLESDTKRSNKSNLIKLLISDESKFKEIDNFVDFGTFRQKLYHFMIQEKKQPSCLICHGTVNWDNNHSKYRETCSKNCSGKLNLFRNNPKVVDHPTLNTKEEYYNYFSSNKIKIIEKSIEKYYPEIFEQTKKITSVTEFNQKIYLYLKDMVEPPLCKNCKVNSVEFDTFSKGYHYFCSTKCSSNSVEKKENIRKTISEKYGCDNISTVTREKYLETMNEKYGCHFSETEIFKEKFKKSMKRIWGVDSPFHSKEIRNKIKTTMKSRYGVENSMSSIDIIKKGLQTKKNKGMIYKWSQKEILEYRTYRQKVNYLTEKTYLQNKEIINPEGHERGHITYHLDHIYPVFMGFLNGVPAEEISHPKNLRILEHAENRRKSSKTQMTLEDFKNMIS